MFSRVVGLGEIYYLLLREQGLSKGHKIIIVIREKSLNNTLRCILGINSVQTI